MERKTEMIVVNFAALSTEIGNAGQLAVGDRLKVEGFEFEVLRREFSCDDGPPKLYVEFLPNTSPSFDVPAEYR